LGEGVVVAVEESRDVDDGEEKDDEAEDPARSREVVAEEGRGRGRRGEVGREERLRSSREEGRKLGEKEFRRDLKEGEDPELSP